MSLSPPTPFGQTVVRITDDSPDPLIGLIVGWEDEDRAVVAWGDEAFADHPVGRVVPIDEITPTD